MGPIKKKFQINTRMLYGIHPLHIKRPLTLTIFQKETVYDKKQHTLPLNHDSWTGVRFIFEFVALINDVVSLIYTKH